MFSTPRADACGRSTSAPKTSMNWNRSSRLRARSSPLKSGRTSSGASASKIAQFDPRRGGAVEEAMTPAEFQTLERQHWHQDHSCLGSAPRVWQTLHSLSCADSISGPIPGTGHAGRGCTSQTIGVYCKKLLRLEGWHAILCLHMQQFSYAQPREAVKQV